MKDSYQVAKRIIYVYQNQKCPLRAESLLNPFGPMILHLPSIASCSDSPYSIYIYRRYLISSWEAFSSRSTTNDTRCLLLKLNASLLKWTRSFVLTESCSHTLGRDVTQLCEGSSPQSPTQHSQGCLCLLEKKGVQELLALLARYSSVVLLSAAAWLQQDMFRESTVYILHRLCPLPNSSFEQLELPPSFTPHCSV